MFIVNNKFIVFILLLFASSDMTSIAMAGFENCIYCHGTFTSGVPYVDLTAIDSGIHGRINNTNNLNYACYACHWDGTPPKTHAKDRSRIKTCEDCHISKLFNAPLVTEHIQNGKDINIAASCITCHSNSVDTNAGYTNLNDRVSHFGTNTTLMSSAIRSNNCIWCHYDNSGSVTWGAPKNPKTSGVALNHAPFTTNTQCYGCHVHGGETPSTFHDSSLGIGGNLDCISCHDTGGVSSKLVDFSATNDSKSVHSNLNADAVTSLNRNNLRCWACHGEGDGSECAQPVGGHPSNYKTPKNCNNNVCHSLSQSRYNESMIYSHFQNSSLNNNPNNATNYNITSVQCQICHTNSLVKKDSNSGLALASHYGSRDDLIGSFNCTYCHLNKDNSKDWGNATLIYKNTTSLIELEKERNKLTAFEGESVYLGEGYSLKVVEISTERSGVLIQFLKNYSIVDEILIGVGAQYKYEEEITIDNGTFKTPIIILNLTSIFRSDNKRFIQFGGFRRVKIHTESNNTACFACHLYRYSTEKQRYLVLDRDIKENPDDGIIYYTKVFIDFKPENKSKIYFNDDDYVLNLINSNFGRFLPSPSLQKYLMEGETWNLGENFSLKLNEVSTDSKAAWLTLMIDNSIVDDGVFRSESWFNYTPGIRYKGYTETNATVFSAKIVSVAQGKPNFILLRDVMAISPRILKITANTTRFGYNSSWLFPNDTFIVGKIPENLHSPNMYTDQRIWADCVRCHDTSIRLKIADIDAISSRLGKHFRLNGNASNKNPLSDSIDKACWACHTLDGLEPQAHSPTYVIPRNCKSCHTYQEKPSFDAINISDELHGFVPGCESCHIRNSHTLIRFGVSPVIKEASLSRTEIRKNETVKLTAEVSAGYGMKIRAVEYFLDEIGTPGNGTPLKPLDGTFDSQIEKVTSDINTTGIAPGLHILYIHAMERTNRWGEFFPVNFTVADKLDASKKSAGLGMVALIIVFVAAYLAVSRCAK